MRGSPVIRQEAIGEDEPPLLVALEVVCPFVQPTFHIRVGLLLGHDSYKVE